MSNYYIKDYALATAKSRSFLKVYDMLHPSGGFERATTANLFHSCASALRGVINRSLGGDAKGASIGQSPHLHSVETMRNM